MVQSEQEGKKKKRWSRVISRLAGLAMIVFLFAAPKWAASGYTAANERERYAKSLMPEDFRKCNISRVGTESQILQHRPARGRHR